MKHLQGKKVKITSVCGQCFQGVVTGATDDIVKILIENQTDQIVVFIKNIFSYQIIGEGVSGGFSGLNVFACKNLEIGCKGKIKISLRKDLNVQDMECEVCKQKTEFVCDFGCLGQMQILPSKVQKILFDGLIKSNNTKEKK